MKSRTVINILLKLYITLYLLFLTSCATLFNRTTTRVDIHTKYPATIIINEDTIKTTGNRAAFIVERSKNSLNVESKTDTLTKTFIVKPMLSSMFFNNFLIFPYGLAGAALDLISVKKYTYPSHIFINPQDKKNKYKIFGNYSRKGEIYLNLSIPEFNFLHQYTKFSGYVNNNGFMGLSAGLDYFYKPLQFVNFTGTLALTLETPLPLPLEYFGPYDYANTKHISISNNHQFYFLSAGYGLSINENYWKYYSFGSFDIIKKSYALGFIFPIYLKLAPYFHLGFTYRPSFFRPYTSQPFKYEHLMSVDLAWKFRVRK